MGRLTVRIFTLCLCIFAVFNTALMAQDAYEASKYFPLDINSKWTYEISKIQGEKSTAGDLVVSLVSGDKLDGKDVYLFKSFLNGDAFDTLYYVLDEGGIYVYKVISHDGSSVVFSPPNRSPFLDIVQAGQKYTTSTPAEIYSPVTASTIDGRLELEWTIEGVEDVVVPAGRFEDCLKISSSSVFNTETSITITTQTRWFALGVGKVKEDYVVTSQGLNIEGGELYAKIELKEATIKGMHIGAE